MFKARGYYNNRIINLETSNGTIWNRINNNDKETNRSLLDVFGTNNYVDVWEQCHQIINTDDVLELGQGDYIDLTNGLPAPVNIAWRENYQNLRLYILGFNCYKNSQSNTLNHILWGFKNIPIRKQMNDWNSNDYGIFGKTLKTYIEGDFLNAMISALGADYFYTVARLVSTKSGSAVLNAKMWLPNEKEIFRSSTNGNDPDPQIHIPLYKDTAHRIKNWNGNANDWWLSTPYTKQIPYDQTALDRNFCTTDYFGNSGTHHSGYASVGVAPCFCQI